MAFVYSLCSSSKGNSTYAGTRDAGILIDVGISLKQFTKLLELQNIPLSAVRGIFITHEHSDHVKGLFSIASLLKVPIYGSRETLGELIKKETIPPKSTVIEISKRTANLAGVAVNAFTTPHDSAHSLGYRLTFEDGKSACVCTDLGCITEEVYAHLNGSDFVLLESNYDGAMLENGSYPWFLKERIFSKRGHLSNLDCASTLLELFNGGTTKFLLGHLSEQNNKPELAYTASQSKLSKTGAVAGEDYILSIARIQSIGETIEI